MNKLFILGFMILALSCGRSTTKEADAITDGATMYFNGDIIIYWIIY
jgi:hypothetical protein